MRTLTECIEKLEELTADDAVNDIREALDSINEWTGDDGVSSEAENGIGNEVWAIRHALDDIVGDLTDAVSDFNEVADKMDELLCEVENLCL